MSLASQLQTDNFVWDAISANLPASRKRGVGKFDVNINCPMCTLRGEPRPDTKFRCGLKRNMSGLGIHCFNCGFKTRWQVGEAVSQPLMSFMIQIGVGETESKRLAHRALVIARTFRETFSDGPLSTQDWYEPKFDELKLPPGARTLGQWIVEGCEDPRFVRVLEYLASRGTEIATTYTYYWTPEDCNSSEESAVPVCMDKRVIIPIYHKDVIVGWTARDTTDSLTPKYYNKNPSDLLFNSKALALPERKYAFLLEGPIDAIAVDSVGTMGAKLSDNQARWINASGKIPVLVVDRDRAGQRNIEHALRHKWHVAFPRLASAGWWDAKTKDVAKAVELYGKLYTIKSILETMTDDPYKIEVWTKLLI